jgi:hypothetical protein
MITDVKVTERDLIKYKCNSSLLFFTRYFYKIRFGRKFVVNSHHRTICEALEKVLRGEITRLIINIAPRYGKTELAVKNFIAHGLGLNPAAKFIHLTYAKNLALDNSEEAKDIVSLPEYGRLYGLQIKKDSKAKEKWYTDAGGGVYATAAGGQVTGFGAGKVDDPDKEEDIPDEEIEDFNKTIQEFFEKGLFGGAMIIDDPIKPDDGYSDIRRTRINERFETTIRNRVNSRTTPIIVIGQRVHEKDLSGYLMDVEPGVWTIIKIPCLREDGTALWEMKHSAEELQTLKRINGYVFESQYQQDPKPIKRGGEFYKLFSPAKNVIKNPVVNGKPFLYRPDLPLHVTFDFNVVPYMTCLVWQINGKKAVQIDEICLSTPRNRTEDVCLEMINRYSDHKAGLFIYGDPSGMKEDTRTEKGSNDYTIIQRKLLAISRNDLRVERMAPPVAMRGNFINTLFNVGFEGVELWIGSNCINTMNDYQFGKEDSDGGKLKEKVKDPVTHQTYEKYHHCSDANDYFICRAFNTEFIRYQKAGKEVKVTIGQNQSKHNY